MITERVVTIYGLTSVVIMGAVLALMWFKVIPESLYMSMFALALVAFAGRIVLRITFARQQRSKNKGEPPQ